MKIGLDTIVGWRIALTGLCVAISANAFATFHFYDIVEVYSNADGTIQFIELSNQGRSCFLESSIGFVAFKVLYRFINLIHHVSQIFHHPIKLHHGFVLLISFALCKN